MTINKIQSDAYKRGRRSGIRAAHEEELEFLNSLINEETDVMLNLIDDRIDELQEKIK